MRRWFGRSVSNDIVQRPASAPVPAAPSQPMPPSVSLVLKESGVPIRKK